MNRNYYCIDPQVGGEGQKLRQDFFEFLQTSLGLTARLKWVKLAPGDAVI